MLLDVLSALFLTHVVHAANVKTNQRRFAPTLPHIAGITGPLHRNTQQLHDYVFSQPIQVCVRTRRCICNFAIVTVIKDEGVARLSWESKCVGSEASAMQKHCWCRTTI